MADNVTRGSKISDCNIGENSKYSLYMYVYISNGNHASCNFKYFQALVICFYSDGLIN